MEKMSLIMVQRINVRDVKGRPCGTPGCRIEASLDLFRPRIAKVRVCDLAALIVRRKHGIFPQQMEEVQKLDNDGLIKFRTEDPVSATEHSDGFALTGGHHRTHEIDLRVKAGRLLPETLVEVLLHD